MDTSAEGSYWMRRIDGQWKIVAFGSPTAEGLREFGGEWEQGPAICGGSNSPGAEGPRHI